MKLTELGLKGVYLIENYQFFDERGGFVKVFNDILFKKNSITFCTKEIYYSVSCKDVIRGMHFHLPPYDHSKIVYVTSGKIVDVVLDLRKDLHSYGKYISVNLESNKNSIYIPNGCAHGFRSLEDNSIVVYNQNSCYSKEHDFGILWNSFGYDWEIINPILSDRDNSFRIFSDFISPF